MLEELKKIIADRENPLSLLEYIEKQYAKDLKEAFDTGFKDGYNAAVKLYGVGEAIEIK